MDPLPEVLLEQIECPICLQYMIPPIEMCLNGHNICKDCRHNIEKCPVCREKLADIRNLTAESMSRLITHPCVNKKFGCTGHFLLYFKEKHEKTCLFRPIVCPFWICEKEGTCLETQEHFKNDHLVFDEKVKDGKNKKTFRRISDVPKIENFTYGAVREFGQVFFAVMIKNFCNLDYIGHFYLGEEEEASQFGYKITLTSQDGKETMSSYRLCRSYLSLNKKLYTDYIGHFYLGEEEEARKFGYKMTLTSQDGNETISCYRLCRSYLSLDYNVWHAMDLFQEVLLQEIECPIYFQYMTPPIKQCLNGHNICKDCRHNIEKCPVCREKLADIRNLTAESMSRLITHPCVNKKFGCTGHFLLDFKEKHEKTCLFRPIVCPDWTCEKEGTCLEIHEHFKNDHLEFLKKAKDGKYKKTFTRIYSCVPKVRIIEYGAVHKFGEVFFAKIMQNICNLHYIGVFYLGEEEEAMKFGYKMTLTSQDGNEIISSYHLCRSYLTLDQKLYTGNNYYENTYSTFPKSFVDKCSGSNNYHTYDFEILQDSTGN
ncbi:hypothetical protein C0J52_27485 [Blattella germanica]|nr:hypothetical protein C0J52_27485 [Blattella germanica]